jgi:hypothetical protein
MSMKKSHFFLLVFTLVVGVTTFLFWGLIETWVRSMDNKTDVAIAESSSDKIDAATQKIETLRQAGLRGEASTITLDAGELNTLIAYRPQWQQLRGKLFVKEIRNGLVIVQGCLPMDLFNGMARRYLNGLFTYKFSIEGVFWSMLPQKITVNDRELSKKATEVVFPILQTLQPGPQLLQDLTLNNLSVEAKDDKLVFTVKAVPRDLGQIEEGQIEHTSQPLSH